MEYRCRYCGAKVGQYMTICGECSKKLKLVRQLQQLLREMKKPKQTNYERIKVMSVEELAGFMNACGHDFPPYCDYTKATRGTCNQNCLKCAKQWLESEVDSE